MVDRVVHCLLLNTDTGLINGSESRELFFFLSHILVWRPSPRTCLSRRCMNSELLEELFDKEGEEGGEEADVDEGAWGEAGLDWGGEDDF